jgi:hypothetical protein
MVYDVLIIICWAVVAFWTEMGFAGVIPANISIYMLGVMTTFFDTTIKSLFVLYFCTSLFCIVGITA